MKVLSENEINEILSFESKDPFTHFGMHQESGGISIRVFVPNTKSVSVLSEKDGEKLGTMEKVANEGLYTIFFKGKKKFFKYKIDVVFNNGSELTYSDPYSFLPVMSEDDCYLFNEGNLQIVYEHFGSHLKTIDGVEGVAFAVWAPSAKRVSVVGNFNLWDGRRHPMRMLGSSGIWELFIPGISLGEVYKYEVKQSHGAVVLKTDPAGYLQEPFPNHGSIVTNLDSYKWNDADWLGKRKSTDLLNRPMSIYEVHLGSWRKAGPNEEGDYLSYRELAHQLAEYLKETGFTHVELMPIQEHPYVPSWGYQVGGFYAVNHRFGTPDEFQYFVDYLHQNGIGVILDWVAGHFPKDEYGLVQFDGTHLYEHSDPREGEHKDWGTLIFNYGRHEVRNFLSSNALFWLEKFHVDGLRVDAVASMLYRNYSREEGEWIPNKYGGAENLEAVEFLQSVNYLVHTKYPGVVTIAEESTAWPLVSKPTSMGGLGFTYKWNMGWMHDTLKYFSTDPIYRKYHHNSITFSLWYAFTENFILVLSHDEVVHGKMSLLEKMPGDEWHKFANLRALYAFMYGHPGKKLLFQGGEFGMYNEWFEKRSIDWHLVEVADEAHLHSGLLAMLSRLNRIYLEETALWQNDYTNEGFYWIDTNDIDNSVLSFVRRGNEWDNFILFVCNFTPIVHSNYRVGVPYDGFYKEIFNSDAKEYGGSGVGNLGGVYSTGEPWQNQPNSIAITLPPLSVSAFKWSV